MYSLISSKKSDLVPDTLIEYCLKLKLKVFEVMKMLPGKYLI